MKIKLIVIVATLLLQTLGAEAADQSTRWIGSASGGYAMPFSMASWMYTTMIKVAEEAFPSKRSTVINNNDGYDITYTGEDDNHIACSSLWLNQPQGIWLCQFSHNKLSNGPLTNRLVSYLLKKYSHTFGPIKNNSGEFSAVIQDKYLQVKMEYNSRKIEALTCLYDIVGGKVMNAECKLD